jgi:hypothetical protein
VVLGLRRTVRGGRWARPGSRYTRDFEDALAWLAQQMAKTPIAGLLRVAWDTVGWIVERVVSERPDERRLGGLVAIGVDEISYRRGQRYLTSVVDHHAGAIVWCSPGRNAQTLQAFFDELGPERAATIRAVSIDMSGGYENAIRGTSRTPRSTDFVASQQKLWTRPVSSSRSCATGRDAILVDVRQKTVRTLCEKAFGDRLAYSSGCSCDDDAMIFGRSSLGVHVRRVDEVNPAACAISIMRCTSAQSADATCAKRPAQPNVMVPSARLETRSPERPGWRYLMLTGGRCGGAITRGVPLTVDRKARVGIDLPQARVEAGIELDPGVARLDLYRVGVVIVAPLDGVDQVSHQ